MDDRFVMSEPHRKIVKKLKEIEALWPKDGTMIMTGSGILYLCTKHPQDGGQIIEGFHIASDGGDPDWAAQEGKPNGQ